MFTCYVTGILATEWVRYLHAGVSLMNGQLAVIGNGLVRVSTGVLERKFIFSHHVRSLYSISTVSNGLHVKFLLDFSVLIFLSKSVSGCEESWMGDSFPWCHVVWLSKNCQS